MRAYFFVNMYLSSIQQGIQAGHAMDQLWCESVKFNQHVDTLIEFASDHKTWILLNGGGKENMQLIADHLATSLNPFPSAEFYEPELGGALTALVIILPEYMYDIQTNGPVFLEDYQIVGYSDWELEFLKILRGCSLAR